MFLDLFSLVSGLILKAAVFNCIMEKMCVYVPVVSSFHPDYLLIVLLCATEFLYDRKRQKQNLMEGVKDR